MRTEDFSYVLPEALIAQEPADPRDSSRLLVLHRDSGELEHRGFRDIVNYLRPGDVIVRNDSRVVPARLLGRRASGGKVEALLLRQNGDAATWEALVKPASRVRVGSAVEFTDQRDGSPVPAEVTAALPEGTRLLRFPSRRSAQPHGAATAAALYPPPGGGSGALSDGVRPRPRQRGGAHRRGCISHRNCCGKWSRWGWKCFRSRCMWGWTPSVRCGMTIPGPTAFTRSSISYRRR